MVHITIIIIITIITELMMHSNKVCVIGAGKWGMNHVKSLYSLGNLGGVVDSDVDRLDNLKNIYNDIKFYDNIEDSFSSNFSGYCVATPAETHYSIVKKLILKKYHVLVEKPLTLNVKEAEELVALSEKNNTNLMVGHLLLFHPAIKKIKEIIESGDIGKLQYIYSNRLNLGEIRTEENVFWSLAPHDISIIQFLTNSFPNKVLSTGAAFVQNDIHDTTITVLDYPENIKAHIFVSWIHPFKEHRLVVIGDRGMITFEDSKDNKPLKLYNKKFILNKNIPQKVDGDIKLINYETLMPLTEELKYFIAHLNGDTIKICSGESGLEVIKILNNATESLIGTSNE